MTLVYAASPLLTAVAGVVTLLELAVAPLVLGLAGTASFARLILFLLDAARRGQHDRRRLLWLPALLVLGEISALAYLLVEVWGVGRRGEAPVAAPALPAEVAAPAADAPRAALAQALSRAQAALARLREAEGGTHADEARLSARLEVLEALEGEDDLGDEAARTVDALNAALEEVLDGRAELAAAAGELELVATDAAAALRSRHEDDAAYALDELTRGVASAERTLSRYAASTVPAER